MQYVYIYVCLIYVRVCTCNVNTYLHVFKIFNIVNKDLDPWGS